jgi:adenylyl cyclase-associated protein
MRTEKKKKPPVKKLDGNKWIIVSMKLPIPKPTLINF